MDEKSNLNSLKEILLDECKLVTYTSISKELCIHVNQSKSLLEKILKEIRQNQKNVTLNVNYIISGLLDDNKAQTVVCNENELSDFQARFKKVFFQHLYSIGVGAPSVDNVSYMAVNKFEDFPLCTGLIKSSICVKRPVDEIGKMKSKAQETFSNEQKSGNQTSKPVSILKHKIKEESKSEKSITSNNVPVSKIQHSTSEPIIKSESPKQETSNSNAQKPDTKNNKNQKGIAGFFNKANTSKKPANVTQDKVKNKTDENKESKNNIVKVENMDIEEVKEESSKTKSTQKSKPNNSKLNKSLDVIKKTAKVDKKRKRVLHVSDSESEEEKNDPFMDVEEPAVEPESDDEIPPTPLANTVKITSGIINPKKKRKIVDKTYTDEDGYILTKKEEVYESCSDNEDASNVKENIKSFNKVSPVKKTEISPKEKKNGIKNKKKMNSPQKGKQATLMNFFKKV